MAVPSFNIAPGESTDAAAQRRRLAMVLMMQGADTSPVQHWTQGAARVAQSVIGGMELNREDQKEQKEKSDARAMYAPLVQQLFGGGQAAAPAAPQATGSSALQNAIAGIESGGKYDAMGPVTKTGDRAHGKYQVMGANIGPWSQEALGRQLSPQEFLADPKAQDAVFNHRFGQYNQKYGPEGAARAWFAGEKGMNNPNAKDQLGTTVAQYGSKFAQALGGQPVTDVSAQRAQTPGQPAINPAIISNMLGNKYLAPTAQALVNQKIGEQFKEQQYDFQKMEDGSIVAINKKNPRDYRVINPVDPQSMIDFKAKEKGAVVTAEETAKRAIAQPEKDKQAKATADIVNTDIDRAIKTIDTAKLPTTGAGGALLSNVGGTAARDLSALLDTVKANAGFDTLAKMRAASPTGGALGSITEKELALLQATVGNLEQSQSADQLKDNLRRLKNVQLDIIHGPGQGPAREKLSFTGSAPDRSAIEQEMRRRGLLK